MPSTYKTKGEFLNAVSVMLQKEPGTADIHSAVLSGVSSAEETIGRKEESKSQAFHLKVGAWVIRDDDIPLFQAVNSTAAAVALSLSAAGLAWPAIATALTSLADICWRTWRKGGRLSPQQVTVYGCLRVVGPVTREALLNHLQNQGTNISSAALGATLQSLAEIELNDGRIIALAAKDINEFWKALKV